MPNVILVTLLFAAASWSAHATTWLVGPTRTYTAPSKVSTLVKDGDTVNIDAGTYEADVARWGANNLVLRGVGGYAHLKANGTSYNGKAIWVIGGNNTMLDSIEFSLCACPDNNGAGIRQEGIDLTVQHCRFHDNEDGILAGDNPTSSIVITHCEFNNNGHGDGYSHNLYINHVKSLTFEFNYSHHAVVGHELKSRAYTNYILFNRLANEATGTASREIDLPNGGTAVIVGNEIEQGPQGQNSELIGYGLEGLSNPTPHRLVLVHNTMVNDRGAGTFVHVQNGTAFYKARNNIFAGPGSVLAGTPTAMDTAANIHPAIAGAGFVDAAGYDYHLLAGSPAIDVGGDPGSEGNLLLLPGFEYLHPADSVARVTNGNLDAGAHEYGTAAGILSPKEHSPARLEIHPNPFAASAVIAISEAAPNSTLAIYDALGAPVSKTRLVGDGNIVISKEELPAGLYFVRLMSEDGMVRVVRTIIVQ